MCTVCGQGYSPASLQSSSGGEKELRRLEPPDLNEAQQTIGGLRSNGCLVWWKFNILALLTSYGQLKLVDVSTMAVTDAPDRLQSLRGEPVHCSQLCFTSLSASRQAWWKPQLYFLHGHSIAFPHKVCRPVAVPAQ